MDQEWKLSQHYPSAPSRRPPTEPSAQLAYEYQIAKSLQKGREITVDIIQTPYDPTLWLQRGGTFLELGYPELAMGDLYKCKLLCEMGLLEASPDAVHCTHKGSTVRDAVQAAMAPPTSSSVEEQEPIDSLEVLQILRETAALQLIEALSKAKCFQDAIDVADGMLHSGADDDFAEVKAVAEQSLERFVAEQRDKGDVLGMARLCGHLRMGMYPWMTAAMTIRSDAAIGRIRDELKGSLCALRRRISAGSFEDDLLVQATSDIIEGQVLLVDSRALAVVEQKGPALCSYCKTKTVTVSTGSEFCSLRCKANTSRHPDDLEGSRPGAVPLPSVERLLPAIQQLHLFLSVCLYDKDDRNVRHRNPLLHPVVSRWKPDYRTDGPLRPFSFKTHIARPIECLQHQGIDIYAHQHFDTWVMLSILNRIAANSLTRLPCSIEDAQKLKIHSLGYLLPLFNHSCNPNVDIVPSGEGTRLVARGTIEKHEELCVSYVNLEQVWDCRAAALKQWFSECRCELCSLEKITGLDLRI